MIKTIVNDQGQVLGAIRWIFCDTLEQLKKSSLCDSKLIPHLTRQIPYFDYPVVVLDMIEVDPQRNGHGTDALRLFHYITSQQGAKFALLRVSPQGDDAESGVLWRQAFYSKQGWITLARPDNQHLIWEWMFRPLETALDTQPGGHVLFMESEQSPQVGGITSLF